MILEQGHKLTMVEMNPTVGRGIYNVVFNDIMSRITPHGPTILTSHQLTAVTDSGAEVKDLSTGETKTVAADTVVLALGTRNQAPLAAEFEAAGLPTVLVGSAETPGRIAGAIRGGFEKAWTFDAE